ncbi:MAG: FkbM family methyltransferase [Gammaproteobacteria bacterium]|uniref:FkbM family methyltransferase n=1 Tax=Rhodoferax sp. TaxID=50421 RepID=UPI001D54770F|nr:FkbM family methyltransferase [Rhodoferax sp.]MBU3898723.1 FkbM family methyltransferase [Gammaproteobacteria bacterium]MBU3997227.1 FkbM family methyltransferase [Gammaproteobacteria bacterium]MBU4080806.1 FkbM family methyltransferase [Gammaproteobacteria bacterium]MBU4112451.1 FkbM family methyltransferase [Gammaproteobacteria bacterium]MBU4169834.1 FkbM family methyltransferase [Gammaproteobacteria bacterium]
MLVNSYRKLRVASRQLLGTEPVVLVEKKLLIEFHGNDYCGWSIPVGHLGSNSVVVDVGLGEDISFSRSLIQKYGCTVHGFDPTPRAIHYVKQLADPKVVLHEFGVAAQRGQATFYLPNNDAHVSGSLALASHVGQRAIEVSLITLEDIFKLLGAERINLLKLDIEGAEFDLIDDDHFKDCAGRIDCLCIEFHHRWSNFGKVSTLKAVQRLRELGFRCAWRAKSTNEEFMFVNISSRGVQ